MWVLCSDQCRLASRASSLAKNLMLQFSQTPYIDNCQTLHDCSTRWALPIYTTFSDLEYVPNVKQIFTKKKLRSFLISWNFAELLCMSSRSWTYHLKKQTNKQNHKLLLACRGDNLHISSFEKQKQTNTLTSSLDIINAGSFKLCMIIILLWVYIVIPDLMTDFVSRSQVCQKHKLQFLLFIVLSTVV